MAITIRDLQSRVRVRDSVLSNFKSVTSPELSPFSVLYQQIRRPKEHDWCDKLLSKPRKVDHTRSESCTRSQIWVPYNQQYCHWYAIVKFQASLCQHFSMRFFFKLYWCNANLQFLIDCVPIWRDLAIIVPSKHANVSPHKFFKKLFLAIFPCNFGLSKGHSTPKQRMLWHSRIYAWRLLNTCHARDPSHFKVIFALN